MNTEDKARFEEMYLAYQNVLRRIAYKYDIPPDYIDDVVQDTFVAYADYKYDLELPEYRKKILLIRILFSRCMDYHRKCAILHQMRRFRRIQEKRDALQDFII